jgi:kynurenine formamidase
MTEVKKLAKQLNNWGRWGPSDEIGTLNYISDAKVAEAARLVKSGSVIELGIPLDRSGPQVGRPLKFNPLHFMTRLPNEDVLPGGVGIADDVVVLSTHAATHWDSLAHIAHNDQIYGGRSIATVRSTGAQLSSIRAVSARVVSRGVLIDMPAALGCESLDPGQGVSASNLEAALARQDCTVGEGDIVLLRTGFLERSRSNDWQGFFGDAPGFDLTTLEWIHDHRLAGIAADTVSLEVKPSSILDSSLPFHVIAIVYMGLLLGEIFDLEELAHLCSLDGRYDFMFVAAPLPITGGVGSPINPYAIR